MANNNFQNIWQSCFREVWWQYWLWNYPKEALYSDIKEGCPAVGEAGVRSKCQTKVCPLWEGLVELAGFLGTGADGYYSLLAGDPNPKGMWETWVIAHPSAWEQWKVLGLSCSLHGLFFWSTLRLKNIYRIHKIFPFREWFYEVRFVNFIPQYSVFPWALWFFIVINSEYKEIWGVSVSKDGKGGFAIQ